MRLRNPERSSSLQLYSLYSLKSRQRLHRSHLCSTILLDLFWILQALGRKSLAKGEVNRITTSPVWYCTSAICAASAATSLSTVNRAAKNWNAQDFKASKIYRTLTGPDWLTKWLYGMLSKRSIADVNSAGTGFVFNTAMQANPFLFALHIHEQRTGSLLSCSGD